MAARGSVAVALTVFAEVLAIDLRRNLVFRRMKTGSPNRLTGVGLDPSCQLVAASGFDPYEVYVWNLQTGHLVLSIADHEGPVAALAFASTPEHEELLVSASWDKTVRLHQMFSKTISTGILQHNAEVVALAIHPIGRELASSTMNGDLLFWDLATQQVLALLPVALDLQPGRS